MSITHSDMLEVRRNEIKYKELNETTVILSATLSTIRFLKMCGTYKKCAFFMSIQPIDSFIIF